MATRAEALPAPEGRPAPAAASSGPPTSGATEIVIDGSAHWRRWWGDLFLYRGALYSLAWRNLRSRYKQAALGALWALIQPAIQVLLFSVLFGRIARFPSGGAPYPVFALAGLLLWNLFSKIMSEGALSLVANQHLITKLFFPRLYLVLAVGASSLLDLAVSLVMLFVLMAVYGVGVGAGVLLAIPALFLMLLLAYGVAALLASVNARWRDVQHTLPFLIQIGMFATPVLYPTSYVPARWRWLAQVNPLTAPIELFRSSLLGLPLPPAHVMLPSTLVAVALVVGGVWFFTRAEATVVDVV